MKIELKKMKMPARKDAEMEPADTAEEGSAEEEASESPEEESAEGDDKQAQEGPAVELAHVSDEDLLAEMHKRGLMDQMDQGQLGDGESAPAHEQDQLPYQD